MNIERIVLGVALSLVATASPTHGSVSFDECEAQLDTQSESEQAAECFYSVARNQGDHSEAVRRLRARIESQSGDHWLYLVLGKVLQLDQSCGGGAEDAYREAAAAFADRDAKSGEILARTSLAWLLARCVSFREAYEVLREVEKDAQNFGDELALRRIELVRLRLEMRSGGDLEAVRERLTELWRLIKQPSFDDGLKIWSLRRECLRALDKVARSLDKPYEAQSWIIQRRDRARAWQDRREEAAAGQALVANKMAIDRPSDANRQKILDELRAVLPPAVQAPHQQIEALIRLEIAKMEGGREAEGHLQRCRSLADRLGDLVLRRDCILALASHRLEDDPSDARRLLEEVYTEELRASDDPEALIDNWQDFLRVLWHTYPRDEALAGAEQVLADVEELRNSQTGMARLELLAAWADPYYWLAGRLLVDGADDDVRRAFVVMERLRAQELREVLLLSEDSDLHLPPLTPDLLERVGAALEEDEAMLSFQLSFRRDYYGRFAGAAWVLASTREGTVVHRLEVDRLQIEPAVEMFERQRVEEWAPESLVGFYHALLRPALDALPTGIKRLVLVPDGILHLLPFAALRSTEKTPALGELYEISIEPSAALWLSWAQDSEVRIEPSVLVFAAPDLSFDSEALTDVQVKHIRALGPLPYARREGKRVLRHLGGAGRLLLGADASEVALKQKDLRPYNLLHFATHAVVDREQPWRSGVLLASGEGPEDGWLGPEEIAGLDLEGKAIILSTCDSAAGGWLPGEGVMSLARAFFEAGAHAVVGTLRPLPDDQAALFFDEFYGYLSEGKSLREALAVTHSRWAAEERPASTWANVVVMGNGDLVPAPGGVEKSSALWLWGALGVCLLAAGLLGLLNRRDR